MEDFLSGREKLGGAPGAASKPRKPAPGSLPPGLGKLQPPEADPASREEAQCEGEGGSKVQYLTENGRVVRIVVTCACGQVTEIDCAYDED